MLMTRFTYRGEDRSLATFFDCDRDHMNIAPKTLSLSMGHNDLACEVMKHVLRNLSMLGPVHFRESDGLMGKPWALLDIAPLDYLSACRDKLELASPLSLKTWLRVADALQANAAEGDPTDGVYGRVLGMTREQAMQLTSADLPYEGSVAGIEQLMLERWRGESSDEAPEALDDAINVIPAMSPQAGQPSAL